MGYPKLHKKEQALVIKATKKIRKLEKKQEAKYSLLIGKLDLSKTEEDFLFDLVYNSNNLKEVKERLRS